MAEGHYFIVNKNLVEMLACLVIATTPTGLWIGLTRRYWAVCAAAQLGARRRSRRRRNGVTIGRNGGSQVADTGPIPLESN